MSEEAEYKLMKLYKGLSIKEVEYRLRVAKAHITHKILMNRIKLSGMETR